MHTTLRVLVLMFLLSLTRATSAQASDVSQRPSQYSPLTEKGTGISPAADPSRDFFSFLRNIAGDQGHFWMSPRSLAHPGTFERFLPLAGFTGGMLAADRSIMKEVPTNYVRPSANLSNYAVFSLAGSAAGAYALGRLARNDHLRETGILSAESAVNSILVASALQHTTGRQRPYEAGGKGAFFESGTSFPSQHALIAWSIAGVVAHEYPGTMTKLLAYGLAATVSATRVTARQHFPSDVLVGSALGWYLGRQIYRAHHNSELGGAWEDANTFAETSQRPPGRMGSAYVALDSWIYPAIERLAAFGFLRQAFVGLKPWTRMQCAQLLAQAADAGPMANDSNVADLQTRLNAEFQYELGLLDGVRPRNLAIALDSVYTRSVSINGPDLSDSDHFGQTLAYDFGRPDRRGFNLQAGGAAHVSIGPAALSIRAEFEHSPAPPPQSEAVRNFIAGKDNLPLSPANRLAAFNQPRLLDAYLALNLREGWQLSFGKQSLSWAPGPGGSLLWSDNIEPIPMLRLTQSQNPLPGFLKYLGPMHLDSFVGRLEGHTFIANPYSYGNKVSFKPLPSLELGFGRTVTLGGKGGTPFTTRNFILSVFGQRNSKINDVPGDSHSSLDWTLYVPKMNNYLVFYGELYADDDFLPLQNLPKNPFRPGIYLTRVPGLSKLDLHVEAVSTESPGWNNRGNLNYWNSTYRDGYTSNGNLIGNTVGRDGRSIQAWLNYWISPRHCLQFSYKNSMVSADFVPGGGAWQDFALRHDITFRSGIYALSTLQYENISRYPLLFSHSQQNVSAILELGFTPQHHK